MSEKIDYKKKLKVFYNPSSKKMGIVTVPRMQFLMINGINALPENAKFQEAIEALFAVSFKAKFLCKQALQQDFVVMPLEGLWWSDDMDAFKAGLKEKWKWTLMIMQPDCVDYNIIDQSIAEVNANKNLPSLKLLELREYEEGDAAQILHIGPYSNEEINISKLHKAISASGGKFDGQRQKHHEIYLSDFRKAKPDKLKTILRQPFTKSSQ